MSRAPLNISYTSQDWVSLRSHLVEVRDRDRRILEVADKSPDFYNVLRGRIALANEILALENPPKERNPQA